MYSVSDDNSAWFEKVKAVASSLGFATDMKAYKADPTAFPGSVSDVAEMLRIATTGLSNTPDLWTIMQILGKERTLARLEKAVHSPQLDSLLRVLVPMGYSLQIVPIVKK